MRDFLNYVKVTVFGVNEKGLLKQNVRNELRKDLLIDVMEVLKEAGYSVSINEEGVGVRLANETEGSIPAIVSVTIKDLDFDLEGAHEDYLAKEEEKAEKELAKERLKEQKLAEKELQKANRAKKATK